MKMKSKCRESCQEFSHGRVFVPVRNLCVGVSVITPCAAVPLNHISEAGDVRIQAHECPQPYSSWGWTESTTSFGAVTDSCP